MAKDPRKRKQNRALKRAGLGMKWQRKFQSEQKWSEAVNKFMNK